MTVEQLEFVETKGGLSLPDETRPSRATARWSARIALPREFAGFRTATLAMTAIVIGLLAWNIWLTRELVELRRHRPVSVSLVTLLTDFVRDQSHQPISADQAALRTRLYLVATQKALADLGTGGTPVLASEAVLANSIPDETDRVKHAVASAMAQAGQH